ncbi:MAG: exo-alpha-sialidase [Planctomycetes bacterium]|nr:exo-alpha-sialidase [Planctomycetota bacterium]
MVCLSGRGDSPRCAYDRPQGGPQDIVRATRQILSELNSSLGNPVLFCDQVGRVHLLFVALRGHYWDSAVLRVTHSDDLGRSWSTPESLCFPPGLMVRYPPIARRNSCLLLPAYEETKKQTVILIAGPDASGWMAVTKFDNLEAIQGCIVRQSDAELTMILRPSGGTRACLRSISSDDGRTWSRVMRTSLPNPLSGWPPFRSAIRCAPYTTTQRSISATRSASLTRRIRARLGANRFTSTRIRSKCRTPPSWWTKPASHMVSTPLGALGFGT